MDFVNKLEELRQLARCSKCNDEVICHRKNCRGKYLDSNNNWKKPYLQPLHRGGKYLDNSLL